MSRADRFIVPVTFMIALLAVLAVTVSWVPRPPDPIGMRVSMGPPGIVPGRAYGLRFTPRNRLSGHILTHLIPSQQRYVDVTITDDSLTYIDQQRASRLSAGDYKLVYRFPRIDDYIIYVEMHPVGGEAQAYRIPLPLDLCALRGPTWHGQCSPHPAKLRGLETVHSHKVAGLTVVLGAPTHALQIEQHVTVSFVFLRPNGSSPVLDTVNGLPGQAVAISMDTLHFTHLDPDPGQVSGGHVKAGAVSFSGWFGRPGIYRIFGTFKYRRRLVRTSFVVDVNPKPRATPTASS